jgi:hypothetical protein
MFNVTKYFKVPRTWTDFLARPKQWKKEMRFGTWKDGPYGDRNRWGELDSAGSV